MREIGRGLEHMLNSSNFFRLVRGAEENRLHPGAMRGFDPNQGILEDQASGWFNAQGPGGS